jgi:hypothetical protein
MKTNLFSVDGPEGTVETTKTIIDVATNFYKELFKGEPRPNINTAMFFLLTKKMFLQRKMRC